MRVAEIIWKWLEIAFGIMIQMRVKYLMREKDEAAEKFVMEF